MNRKSQVGPVGAIFVFLVFIILWFVWLGGWVGFMGKLIVEQNNLTGVWGFLCSI